MASLDQAGGCGCLARRPPRVLQALTRLGDTPLEVAQLLLGALGRLRQLGGLASVRLDVLRPALTLGTFGHFGELGGLALVRLSVLGPAPTFGVAGGPPLIQASTAVIAPMHEPERGRRLGAGEDFESGRTLLGHQPSVAEVLGESRVDRRAEQGVGHATVRRRGRAVAVLREELAGPTDQSVELAPLAVQGFASRSRILELRTADIVHRAHERFEAPGLGVRQLVGGPQHDRWPTKLAHGPRLGGAAGGLQRCGSGVPGTGEILWWQGVEFLDESIDGGAHGLSVACGCPDHQRRLDRHLRAAVLGAERSNMLLSLDDDVTAASISVILRSAVGAARRRVLPGLRVLRS